MKAKNPLMKSKHLYFPSHKNYLECTVFLKQKNLMTKMTLYYMMVVCGVFLIEEAIGFHSLAYHVRSFISETNNTLLNLSDSYSFRLQLFCHCLTVNSCDSVAQQCEIFLKACREIPDTGFKICSDFHLSLTKTLVFRHHWIDPFLASLKEPLGKLQT